MRAVRPEAVGIFILPPSATALRQRLQDRGTDHADVIERRLGEARRDMSHHAEFDFVIVNEDFDRALADLRAVVHGEAGHLRRDRPELQAFENWLLAQAAQTRATLEGAAPAPRMPRAGAKIPDAHTPKH